MRHPLDELIPKGEARCYVPLTTQDTFVVSAATRPVQDGEEVCPDNGERPCTCISPKGHPENDPRGSHGCHCGRQWAVRRD